jgi:hypothetical protein
MDKIHRICFALASVFVLACSHTGKAAAQEELDISGIPLQVVAERKASFKTRFAGTESISTTQLVVVFMPDKMYSRENLEIIWRHFKQAYPDKKETLDLKVYITTTFEFNRQHFGDRAWIGIEPFILSSEPLPRLYEAHFERQDVALTNGEDQELLSYIPDLNKPEARRVVVLAGKDSRK